MPDLDQRRVGLPGGGPGGAPGGVAAPSLEDPVVRAASEVVGGPVGRRAAGASWWRPVRVVVAVACVFWALALLQKAPCSATDWSDGTLRARAMCYSDIPYLYAGRGFAELSVPYSDTGGRYPYLEYPVGTGYFTYGVAWATHALNGFPDTEARAALPTSSIGTLPEVRQEARHYVLLTGVLLTPFALLSAYFMAGAHRRRPWDAMAYAAAPVVVATGLINWDLLAVCAVTGAMWAWARGRPVVAGLMIGVGAATKLYPLFLLGALLVVCLRRRQLRDFFVALGCAVGAWLVVDLPPLLANREGWLSFWSFNSERGPDLGSLWLVASHHGWEASAHTVNVGSWIFFSGWCLLVLAIGLWVRHVPRVAQLAFLIVLGFLLVNKVYSPQYVLWLLPLAVLAVPRWRHLLVWQTTELVYFSAVWWHLEGFTDSATDGAADPLYSAAVALRVLGQLYLAAVVLHQMARPRRDPTRTFPDDDPMCAPGLLAPTPRRRGAWRTVTA